ncbi:RteC protein [Gelidibacter algens]|uniref:RteC protein n=1 Tax=Gelidibacter algens TaxID=49280 RepID=A0A327S9X7_9FLAO|nr:RteC domain-containing protein [Gelidibacter algens]RAJ25142.1 RteC protein [Gelidibacter algens]
MNIYYNLINVLESKLHELEENPSDILQKTEQGVKLIKETLHQLMPLVIHKKFDDPATEIEFFKIIKPRVFSKLIYYVKRFNIESKRPKGSNKEQVKYLNNYIRRLQYFFNNNLEFYNYYKVGATYLDHQYFIRGSADIR